MYARTTSVKTEMWNLACERKSGNTRCFPARNEIALVVMQHSSCELSNESHTALFLEFDLARINSTVAQDPCVNHLPSLPQTPARGTYTLVACCSALSLFSLTSYILCPSGQRNFANGVWWIPVQLGQCQVLRVDARSVMHAQVAGAATIGHAMEETHFP